MCILVKVLQNGSCSMSNITSSHQGQGVTGCHVRHSQHARLDGTAAELEQHVDVVSCAAQVHGRRREAVKDGLGQSMPARVRAEGLQIRAPLADVDYSLYTCRSSILLYITSLNRHKFLVYRI